MKKIIDSLSFKYKLSPKQVKDIYNSYWSFIRNKITALPLKEDLTEEEFNKLKVNFNIMHLGKLNCTYNRYRLIKNTITNDKHKKSKITG